MRDIRVVLLAFEAVLIEDATFERHGGGGPVIRGHGVGEGDDQVELTDRHQGAVHRAQGLLCCVVHGYGSGVCDVSKTPADGFATHAVVAFYFAFLGPLDAADAFEYC